MNTLVTGATGFIGLHLSKELIQMGYTVFGLSHSGRIQNIKSLLHKKEFHLQRGDIRDVNILSDIIRVNNIKVIFHLAAQLPRGVDINNPFLCFDVNAKGTLNLLNAAYLDGVDKFIYASSRDVYSVPPKYLPVDEKHPVQPSTIYGVSKLEGELYCNLYSETMDIVVLRYSIVYGKGNPKHNAIPTFTNQALNNRPITIHGDGTQTSDFVNVKDVIHATLLVLEKDKTGVYNIGSGEEISVRYLAELIINLTDSKSEIVLADKDTDRPFRFVLDITKAREVLGYYPIPINEGLKRYITEVGME